MEHGNVSGVVTKTDARISIIILNDIGLCPKNMKRQKLVFTDNCLFYWMRFVCLAFWIDLFLRLLCTKNS